MYEINTLFPDVALVVAKSATSGTSASDAVGSIVNVEPVYEV